MWGCLCCKGKGGAMIVISAAAAMATALMVMVVMVAREKVVVNWGFGGGWAVALAREVVAAARSLLLYLRVSLILHWPPSYTANQLYPTQYRTILPLGNQCRSSIQPVHILRADKNHMTKHNNLCLAHCQSRLVELSNITVWYFSVSDTRTCRVLAQSRRTCDSTVEN